MGRETTKFYHPQKPPPKADIYGPRSVPDPGEIAGPAGQVVPSPGIVPLLQGDRPVHYKRPLPPPANSKFLFRGGAVWWYDPFSEKHRKLVESGLRVQKKEPEIPISEASQALKDNSPVEKLDNRIKIYLYEEEEAVKYGGTPYLVLDFVPNEIEVQVGSLMKSLNIVGLNYPKYHFGGGEDVINFEIDWYGHKEDKDSVISKCRRMEALTKADGWSSGPPEIIIRWDHEGSLFAKHVFIVEKAGYRITDFQLNKTVDPNGTYEPFGLLPIMAKQKVTLKRIASQLTYDQIIYPR